MAIDIQLQRQILERVQNLTPDAIQSLILNEVWHLTPDQQLTLIQELLALYQSRVSPQPTHSLRELRGLGKETWKGIDAQTYVDEERNSWDG